MRMRHIAIFGLSANPPTGDTGHRGIIKYLCSRVNHDGSSFFDEIIILPVYQHMFSLKRNLIEFDHRFNMCKLNFDGISQQIHSTTRITISDLERELYCKKLQECENKECRVGTIDILECLQNIYPNDLFQIHLILGMDTFCDLMRNKWMRSRDIVKMTQIEVFKRIGVNQHVNLDDLSTYPLLSECRYVIHDDNTLGDISSTSLRNIFSHVSGNFESPEFLSFNSLPRVHPLVLEYIEKNKLYQNSS